MTLTHDAPFLKLHELSKRFGDQEVLRDLSVEIAEGEILALLGPSGSGKTTALRLVAGFETPERGRIVVGDDDVTGLAPAARGFGMVFQHYALFPHMTVEENVAFGLASRGVRGAAARYRVDAMLELVDLTGFGTRRVSEISGGQQQRVALARALAPEPRVLLLDEPLSNLDPTLREKTRRELREAVRLVGITTLFVTHEQEEAFHVGDRVAVLHHGRLEQVGRPEELYERPASRFVATFVGRASTLSATVAAAGDGTVEVDLGRHAGTDLVWSADTSSELLPGARVDFVVRPESLRLAPPETPGTLRGDLVERRFLGALTYGVVALVSGAEIEVLLDGGTPDGNTPGGGEAVAVALRPEAPVPHTFPLGGSRGDTGADAGEADA